MLFNSFEFALFLPLVFLLYWFVFQKNLKVQNLFMVAVSYLFYGWWDWRFLLLIAFTSLCSFWSGTLIEKYRNDANGRRYAKTIAAVNVVVNLLILCLFKYFNFFSENLAVLFRTFGLELDWITIDILLPVGISFYTFQALGYTIDVYRRKIEPTHDVVSFFAFVSFFPQLVAGPIERATQLLPQFHRKRTFDYAKAVDGMRQILWGLFKKIVVADNCARVVDDIFNNYQNLDGATLLFGGVLFSFQIYGDFSGYSDIAIGSARLFGIDLMRNFNFPYFSRDIAEFWRRWHISLTTWFRDYIYIPLGGSRHGMRNTIINTFIIFIISGLWHGANWTFVVWGAYHALMFAPLILLGLNRRFTSDTVAPHHWYSSPGDTLRMAVTFLLVTIGFIIFRSDNIAGAVCYLDRMFSVSLFGLPQWTIIETSERAIVSIAILVVAEWFGRKNQFALQTIPLRSRVARWLLYFVLVAVIVFFAGKQTTFIYFQF